MSNIYKEIILDHYRYPHNFCHVAKPTNTASADNPLCGDQIGMEVAIRQGKVAEIGFNGRGCAISLATASLLTDYAKGKPINELLKLEPDFIIKLLQIELGPNRLKCALLPLEVLQKTLKQYEQSKK